MSLATSSGKKPKKGGKAKKGGKKSLTNKNGEAMLLKRGGFLANMDENELSQTAVWQKRGKKNRHESREYRQVDVVKNDDSEDDADVPEWERAPRATAKTWQEKEEALPIKNDDGQAEQPAPEITGPRPFAEETMSKKQQKRIEEQAAKDQERKEAREQRKEERKAEAVAKKAAKKSKKETEVEILLREADTVPKKKMLIAKAAERITVAPNKDIELFEVFWALLDHDMLGGMALMAAVAVMKDILPGFKIEDKSGRFKDIKLSKEVERLNTYEDKLLAYYKQLLTSLEIKRKVQPKLGFTGLAELLKVGSQFNLRNKLINLVVRGACHEDEEVSRICVDAVRDVAEGDRNLEPSEEIVKVEDYTKIFFI